MNGAIAGHGRRKNKRVPGQDIHDPQYHRPGVVRLRHRCNDVMTRDGTLRADGRMLRDL
jgi:hypothetical protein